MKSGVRRAIIGCVTVAATGSVLLGANPAPAPATTYGGCVEGLQPGNATVPSCWVRPAKGWHGVPTWLADALAESGLPHADTRKWERCVVHIGRTDRVFCPDGFRAPIS